MTNIQTQIIQGSAYMLRQHKQNYSGMESIGMSELLNNFSMQWALNRKMVINDDIIIYINSYKMATSSQLFCEILQDIPQHRALYFNCQNICELKTAIYFSHLGVSYNAITESNLEHHTTVAAKYKIPALHRICMDFVIKNLSRDNAWLFWRAMRRSVTEYNQQVYAFLLRYFREASFQAEFSELSMEEFGQFLGDDCLNINEESELMEIIDRWITFAPQRRRHAYAFLVSRMRLGQLSKDQLESIDRSPHIMKAKSSSSLRALHQVKRSILRNKKNLRPLDAMAVAINQPRVPHEAIFVLGGYEQNKGVTQAVRVFDSRKNQWINHSSDEPDSSTICLPTPRMSFGASLIDNHIFIVGGEFREGRATQEVISYDLITRTWRKRAPMHEVRRDLSTVSVDNTLYAIGGDNNRNVLNSVERYCSRRNQWIEMAGMLIQRAAAASSTLNGMVYVCGGYTELYMEALTNSCETYNPQTDQWSYIKTMTQPRFYIQGVTLDGYLYVLGGAEEQQWTNSERYNPVDNVWEPMPGLQHARADFAACVFDNELVCLGGGDDTNCTAVVERWKPGSQTWRDGVALPSPVWGHRCICVHGVDRILPHLKRNTRLGRGDDLNSTRDDN